ncbi:type II toxin-antitoxin system MqsA family antitoxin [Methanoregula sp.]|uniref:type II toxin-antitoxin system MqsA family antitoxin n=1 Tax=Methanoregula sp. TaxID=2052170 RepID=UPI003C578D79
MATSKTKNTEKLFMRKMKEKFAENPNSISPVFAPKDKDVSTTRIGKRSGGHKIESKSSLSPSRVKFDRCSFCDGTLEESTTEFMGRAGNEIVVIKDVPAYVCENCGESYYTTETSRKIDVVMRGMHQKTLCVRPLPAGEVSLNI